MEKIKPDMEEEKKSEYYGMETRDILTIVIASLFFIVLGFFFVIGFNLAVSL